MRYTKLLYMALAVVMLASCEKFLDTESYTKKIQGTFQQIKLMQNKC